VTPAHPTEPRADIFTVGLTGGIGSGKSTVAEGFKHLGICVIDTDEVAHALTAAGGAAMPAIVAAFGNDMRRPDGALDRATMRQRVFADATARQQLEHILHPLIHAECTAQLRQADSPYAMLAVPLLAETHVWREACDRILLVDCPEACQIERVRHRNGLSREEILRIMATQADRTTRRNIATEIIDNSDTVGSLVPRIQALHEDYLQASAKPRHRS